MRRLRYVLRGGQSTACEDGTGGKLPHVPADNVSTLERSQMSQPGYNQYQYPNYPNVQQNNSLEFFHGSKFKEKSVIYGVIGFLFLGIVFGPLAISNANKAEALHHSATLGKVLGWIDTIVGVFWLLIFLFAVVNSGSGA
jgi:hypothetical protein